MTTNIVRKVEGEMSLITWIKSRIKRNENLNLITTGPTGSGKSYCDIRLAIDMDPTFDVQKQVIFTFKQLLQLLKDEWFMAKQWKVIVFEELQISQNSRNWYSKMNKLLNYLLSTYRHRNIILLVNCPYDDFVDSQTRRLFHMIIEMKSKNQKTGIATIRPKILQYYAKKQKFYEHSIYVIQNHKAVKTPYYQVKIPPKDICKVYEEMKTNFTTNLNEKIEQELMGEEQKEKAGETRLRLTQQQQQILDCIDKGIIKQKDIGKAIGRSQQLVGIQIQSIIKKGYHVPNYTKTTKNNIVADTRDTNLSSEPLDFANKTDGEAE